MSQPSRLRLRGHAFRFARRAALLGPGLLVMLADCDAGNVLVAAQAGAMWGYLLLPAFAALAPLLYWTQQASADLGRRTGLGFGEAIRARFGAPFARACAVALALSCLATLIAEMTGIAGAGSVFGVPAAASLAPAAGLVAFTAAGGRARRLDALVVGIGLFEA
ncbi:divalent metal cation transporter, partial [Burkholderia sp. Ac-20379]|uniref:divalent metal cation transporter n=1 Tax=Burkholderia sp. Ac-20379 TaxID=2703900 RepID=UPI001981BBEC